MKKLLLVALSLVSTTIVANDASENFLGKCRQGEFTPEEFALIELQLHRHEPKFSFKNPKACEEAKDLLEVVWTLHRPSTFKAVKSPRILEIFPQLGSFPGSELDALENVDCSAWKEMRSMDLSSRMTQSNFAMKNCENIESLFIHSYGSTLESASWDNMAKRTPNIVNLTVTYDKGNFNFFATKLKLFKKLETLAIYNEDTIYDFTPLAELKKLEVISCDHAASAAQLKCPTEGVSRGLRNFCRERLGGAKEKAAVTK